MKNDEYKFEVVLSIKGSPVGILKYSPFTKEIEFIIEIFNSNGERLTSGEHVFYRLMEILNENVKSISGSLIQAEWTTVMPGNLNQFNKYLKEHPNASLEEAARNTFTSRQAEKHGYNRVVFEEEPEGERGEYTDVRPIFYK